MKVFVVEQIGYSYYGDEIREICGIFSTEEKAIAYQEIQNPNFKFEISEFGMDVADGFIKYDIQCIVG